MPPVIDKLAWIYLKDKKVLGARSRGKKLFYIPGGKREPGESDEEALVREIREELSVELLPRTITFCETFSAQADGKPEGTNVKMTCYRAEYSGEIKASAEIEETRWLTSRDIETSTPVGKLILKWLKENQLID